MTFPGTGPEAMAAEFEGGLTREQLSGDGWEPGRHAWRLDVVDDWDAFAARAQRENLTPEELVRRAAAGYLRPAS